MHGPSLPEVLAPYNRSRIAEHVGVSRNTVSNWYQGTSSPEYTRLPKLAEILRMDVAELIQIVARDVERRGAEDDRASA